VDAVGQPKYFGLFMGFITILCGLVFEIFLSNAAIFIFIDYKKTEYLNLYDGMSAIGFLNRLIIASVIMPFLWISDAITKVYIGGAYLCFALIAHATHSIPVTRFFMEGNWNLELLVKEDTSKL